MAYCNITTDLKTRGRYVNANIPTTLFSSDKLTFYTVMICDKIHSYLYKAGITTLPVVAASYPNAYRRLKDLNALGAIALMEESAQARGDGQETEEESISKTYWKEFYATLKLYTELPAALFEGDADLDLINVEPIPKKRASGFRSYPTDTTRIFSVDDKY